MGFSPGSSGSGGFGGNAGGATPRGVERRDEGGPRLGVPWIIGEKDREDGGDVGRQDFTAAIVLDRTLPLDRTIPFDADCPGERLHGPTSGA